MQCAFIYDWPMHRQSREIDTFSIIRRMHTHIIIAFSKPAKLIGAPAMAYERSSVHDSLCLLFVVNRPLYTDAKSIVSCKTKSTHAHPKALHDKTQHTASSLRACMNSFECDTLQYKRRGPNYTRLTRNCNYALCVLDFIHLQPLYEYSNCVVPVFVSFLASSSQHQSGLQSNNVK